MKEGRIQNVSPKVYGGVRYRSTLEAETARTLDALGIPFRYEDSKYELVEGFRTPYQKNKVIGITYTPDFEIGNILLECKGFETPEWKIKRKLLFKYLMENCPEKAFYEIHDCRKSLLEALDGHWEYLGYSIRVTAKGTRKNPNPSPLVFDSIAEVMSELGLKGRPIGPILRSLTGKTEHVYGYKWELVRQ